MNKALRVTLAAAAWLVAAGSPVRAMPAVRRVQAPAIPELTSAEKVGEAIYLKGVLGSGAPLRGTHDGGITDVGADAACVNCHQRSGLGGFEGRVSVPPITGQYLFHSRSQESEPLPYVESLRNHDAYTDESLSRAIREGVDVEGRPFEYLMPRYAIGEDDMAGLLAYLKKLSPRRVPGVTETVLHFATIITPDADPTKRDGVLGVLEKYFAQKNRFPLRPSPRMTTSSKTQSAKSMYMANRQWELHVWELTGPAETWREQLDRHLAEEPVYAVLSGVGGTNWAPVHEFCEQHAIPCLFPNVEVPVVAKGDFYSLYFSKGVLLEAQLMASAILDRARHPMIRTVEQVYRAGDSGEAAAASLQRQLEGRGITVRRTVIPAAAGRDHVTVAVRKAEARNEAGTHALVLWLRPEEIAALRGSPPVKAQVYLSGLMGGLERSPLPPLWRERAIMTYPFDLPDRRGVRLDYPLGFFSFHHIPVVAEQVQTDTYLACSLLAEVVNKMADNFVRPYLIEQLQGMLEHRMITGYYPRLSLASSQQFASKGGYLVRFRDHDGTALVHEGDWIVP